MSRLALSTRTLCASLLATVPLVTPLALPAQQQRPGQVETISIQDAFNEQLHPPLPRTHTPEPTVAAITAGDLMTRLYIYAADSMMGRETGTPGHVKATNYIAGQLKLLGLKPAGDKGTYFQNLPVVLRSLDPKSTITVNGKTYVAGRDFIATAGRGGGPIGTVRPGEVIYNAHAADTVGALTVSQVAGKIVLNRAVVVPGGGRGGFAGGGRGGAGARMNPLDSALGVVTIVDSITTTQMNSALNPSNKGVVFTGIPDAPAVAPTITITKALAEVLLGMSLDEAKRGTVGKTMTANLKFIQTPMPARNVVAILPGSDAKLRGEYVAIGAHNDHVGYAAVALDHDSVRLYNAALRTQGMEGQSHKATPEEAELLHTLLDSLHKVNGVRLDSINNGADDDGSGSVTLLEIAEAFAKAPAKPKRSILFIWHVAEEKGLWGSDFFTRYPTVPRDSIVAQLNMDMVGRGKAEDIPDGGPNYVEPVGWRKISTQLGDMAEKVNMTEKIPFKFDLQYDAPNQANNIYCRSDHANYARFGIPIVYFTTGLHRDYHQVTDEPQYIDYSHMASVGQYMFDLAVTVADMDHRPVVDGNRPKDPFARCVNNGVVPDSAAIRGGAR
jgi:hypothetical protein